MRDFRNLIAWQKASALEDQLEPIVQRIKRNRPALADQIDRAVSSIAANISEGCGRATIPDFKRFLSQAIGSTTELENHLLRARKLDLISEDELKSLSDATTEVRKIIHGLYKSLQPLKAGSQR
jgi:four helix bundle protein